MNVRDDRDGADVMNGAQGLGCRLVWYGDAHDFAARVVQSFDLAEGGLHVPRVGIRHALDDDGRTAADTDGAEFQLSSLFAGEFHILSFWGGICGRALFIKNALPQTPTRKNVDWWGGCATGVRFSRRGNTEKRLCPVGIR